jgi:hypothetical protein
VSFLKDILELISYTISYTISQMPWLLLPLCVVISFFSILTFKASSLRAVILPMTITLALFILCLIVLYCFLSSIF